MKTTSISPRDYHSILTFDRNKLPDLAAAGHVSASVLCDARDPLAFLTSGEKKSTKAMEWGNLVDCLWLTPELFDATYIVLPEDAPQKPTAAMLAAAKPTQNSLDRQAWWKDWELKSRDRISIKEKTHKEALAAVSMLNQHPVASEIRKCSATQVVIEGGNPWGMPGRVKAMLDLFPGGVWKGWIWDLKQTNDVTNRGMKNTTWKFEYHVKMCFYALLAQAAGLGPIQHLGLIWQRSKFPYDVHVREMDPDDIAIAEGIIERRFQALQEMDPNNLAALFDTEVSMVSLDAWQRESAPGAIEDEENEPAEEG